MTTDLVLPPLPTAEDAHDLVLDNDTIAVVVTSYNQPQYIAETVQSVAGLEWQHLRCIVVDDGSKDGGDAAAAAIASVPAPRRDCFELLRMTNQGPAHARNAGFAALPRTIQYALFVDGDDVLLPDALMFLRRGMGDAPAAAGCVLPIDGAGRITPRFDWYATSLPPLVTADSFRSDRWLFVTPGTTLYRTAALRAVGGWPDTLRGPSGEDWRGEDVMLACRVAHACGPIAGVSIPILKKREHAQSFCQSDIDRLQRASLAYQAAVAAYLSGGK